MRDAHTPLFFYGSLRDDDLRRAVCGGDALAKPALAKGWRVVADPEGAFPTMFQTEGAQAVGVAMDAPSDAIIDRLQAFEGDGYALSEIAIEIDGETHAARSFLPTGGFAARLNAAPMLHDWDFERWRREDGEWIAEAAERWRRLADDIGLEAADRIWPDLAGGAAAMLARPHKLNTDFSRGDVDEIATERVFDGFRSMDRFVGRYRRYDGAMSGEVRYLAMRSCHAASVLPYDPKLDAVLLIEQWRIGAWLSGAPRPWQIELPAGGIDEGEAEEAAARREALEEAGVELGRVEQLYRYFAAPAITDETMTMFVGEANLAPFMAQETTGGLLSEQEDIRVFAIGREAALEAAARGDIDNAFPLLALNWLDRHYQRLASVWR